MMEPPDLSADAVVACLRSAYGLSIADVTFLPLGADQDSAVYRTVAEDGVPYFLKLRRGDLFEPAVSVPHWLHAQGVRHIVAPIAARDGKLWTRLEPFTAVLYPFIAGRDAADRPFSYSQLSELGAALRRIHDANLPSAMQHAIPHETYDPYWRERIKMFQALVAERSFDDPVAAKAASLLRDQREGIAHCVARAGRLAEILARQSPGTCLCHSDVHAWNILVAESGAFYIVDWDTPIYAPRERDLMFVGAFEGMWDTTRELESFFDGYGAWPIDRIALAYYRCERVVQDIEACCESLLLTEEGGADREGIFEELSGNFAPGGALEYALATEEASS